jgi:RNA polymerase sigma-70 factor (ECF subfamily)
VLEEVFRDEWGRVLASLVRFLGDFDKAEEAAQEAFAIAAVAQAGDPAAALRTVDRLDLDGYLYFHSTRGELLRRLGRDTEARAAYSRALELATSTPERRFLTRRLEQF